MSTRSTSLLSLSEDINETLMTNQTLEAEVEIHKAPQTSEDIELMRTLKKRRKGIRAVIIK